MFSMVQVRGFERDGLAEEPLERSRLPAGCPALEFRRAVRAEHEAVPVAGGLQFHVFDHLAVAAVQALGDA
jgi:hypothetical protein